MSLAPSTLELAGRCLRILKAAEFANLIEDRNEVDRLFASIDPADIDDITSELEAEAVRQRLAASYPRIEAAATGTEGARPRERISAAVSTPRHVHLCAVEITPESRRV